MLLNFHRCKNLKNHIMLSVVMLSVVMLSVVAMAVAMAPSE
jgi:hypothetical protein